MTVTIENVRASRQQAVSDLMQALHGNRPLTASQCEHIRAQLAESLHLRDAILCSVLDPALTAQNLMSITSNPLEENNLHTVNSSTLYSAKTLPCITTPLIKPTSS